MISIDFSEVKALAKRMDEKPRKVKRIVAQLMKDTAQRTMELTIANASGRPGPNIVTGDYVASFFVKQIGDLAWFMGNTQPQAARLEFGFSGRDSLGRSYNQPPFPHFRPAARQAQVELSANLKALIEEEGLK